MYKVNNRTKEIAKEVNAKLSKLLKKDVTNGFIVGGDSADFLFYIHENKYDYKQIFVKQLNEVSKNTIHDEVEFYAACVTEKIENRNYDNHVSTVEERFIIDKLEENNCKNLYVMGNELYENGNLDAIYIPDIDVLNYDKNENSIYIETNDDGRFYIDLNGETITWINEDETEEEDKGAYWNWNELNGKQRECIFQDKDFKDNSFCSAQGTIFVNKKFLDRTGALIFF